MPKFITQLDSESLRQWLPLVTLVLLVTLVGTFLVRLPIAYLASVELGWGLTGIWAGSTADWIVEAALLLTVFRRGAWRDNRV